MLTSSQVAQTFLDCFDKSAATDFHRFVEAHPHVRKWIIAADFSLHQKDRPYDCYAFSILPYEQWPDEMMADVAKAIPRDLKESKELTPEGIAWLRDSARFHIVIVINKDRVVFTNHDATPVRTVAREHVALTLAAAERVGRDDQLLRVKRLKQESLANSFKVTLLTDLWLLALWFAVVTVVIGRDRQAEIIGWFPDRDDMTIWCDGIWRDYAHWMTNELCETFCVDMSTTRVFAGGADPKTGKLWYDEFIRSADWFAGAIAAWERAANLVPGERAKYIQMVQDVIADTENVAILHINIGRSGLQCRRVTASRQPSAA